MDSYAALPLNDSNGLPLGLIATMDRRPMRDAALAESMLKIFAMRAVAEIERTRADAALRASEASYRAIFEASEDEIFVHDWDTGAFVDANPKACRTFGYSVEEFRRLTVAELSSGVPPYTVADAARWIEKAKGGEAVAFEWHRRHRDGTLHWGEVCLKAAEIAGTRRILAFTREITARKAAEDALRASEEQYRAIFNASADALVLWNSRSQRVDVNPAYEEMYGYSRDEVLRGARARDLPAEYRRHQEEIVARTLAGERCHEEVMETFRRTGGRFPIEVRTIPIQHRGEPHVLAMIRDLTERRQVEDDRARLEAQLRQAQKMEAIGHLTGGIAHDFNNLLTGIMGYVTLAAERSADGRDDKLASYLEQAHLACGRARDLIQQMLTFSRSRRGEPRTLALAPLIRESVKLLRSSLPATVALGTDLDDDAPPVLLDPTQLEQVLMNLAINARDAMRSSGKIRVAVRFVGRVAEVCTSCRKNVEGDMVELSVSDNGPGIAADVQERMFEPFYTTKDIGQGSGMGLSTVHGIVHEHGGHVVVESVASAGARFRVLLPALRSQERGDAVPRSATRGPALPRVSLGGRVAVIDDEASVASFMSDLLTQWGLEVTTFANARAALDAIAGGAAFDLLISDQTMPGMTGIEFARAMREICAALPVVLYTGYDEGLAPATIERAGVVALVRKPIEPHLLVAVLEKYLRRPMPPH
jgi:PAS domain S-box-containing protein